MFIELFYKVLAISFSLLILINGALIQRIVGTWLFPACILSLFWFAYTFFPLVFLFSYPINPYAVGFIALCIILFSWSSMFFRWKKAFGMNGRKEDPGRLFNSRLLRWLLYGSSILSVILVTGDVLAQGFGLGDLFTRPFEVAETYTKLRYEHLIDYTILSRIGLALSYTGVIVGGLLYGSNQKKGYKRAVLLLAFLPALIIILFQGAKGMLFTQIFFFLGSLMIIKFYNDNTGFLTRKNIHKLIEISLFLLPLVIISFLSRGLYRMNDAEFVWNKLTGLLSSYAFGHLYAFSDWFTFRTGGASVLNYKPEGVTHGFYTFTSLFHLFGSTREEIPGVYAEFLTSGEFFRTNIFTIFRGLITDFGFIGTILFFITNSIIIHFVFLRFLKSDYSPLAIAFLIFTMAYFYITYGVSLLSWDIILPVFLLVVLLLFVNRYKFTFSGGTKPSDEQA